jgi:molecular chaperone DnaJ
MSTMASNLDYYEVLGVERTATSDEISMAYRKLAIRYHPDKNPGDHEAIEQFKQAAEAFEVLNDPDKRQRYDRYGRAGLGANAAGAHFNDVEDIFSAFGDLFGDLFGGGRGGRRRRPSKGRDVRCDVTMTLAEAAIGVEKSIEFQRHNRCETCAGSGAKPGTAKETCQYCGGHGRVIQSAGIVRVQTTCPSCNGEGVAIKHPCTNCQGSGFELKNVKTSVHIPAGVDDGMRVRIPGEGEPSPNGGPRGDCYCFISVLPHPLFERDGRNLICRVPITYTQAALGATIEIPTLQGREELTIQPGAQSGDVFRIRSRGMPDPRQRGLGDLLVSVKIDVPKKVTAREEELLRELAGLEHSNVSPHRKNFFEKLKAYFTPDDEDSVDGKE